MLNEVRQVPGANGTGLLSWSPQYDIRNCGFGVLLGVARRLRDVENWAPGYAEVMGDDADRLGHALHKFLVALKRTIGPERDRRYGEVGEGLAAEGYFDEPAAVRLVIGAELGMLMTGTMVHGLREFSFQGEVSLPYERALEQALAGGAAAADALIGGAR